MPLPRYMILAEDKFVPSALGQLLLLLLFALMLI